ncbi:MAG: hypothetical protein MRY32_09120 [Rickettsiales bacterium]|nr:hypothetical protein [Rickettsiales bacterium]
MIPTLSNESEEFLSSDSYFNDFAKRLDSARSQMEISREKYAWLHK